MCTSHVIYLSYDGLTDPLGQSQVLPYVEGLNREGFRFTLISFEKPDRYASYKELIQGRCRDTGINWIPLPYTKRPPVLSTLWDLWKLKRTIEKVIKNQTITLFHCRSYLTTLFALEFKRKYGIPFLFDMRGFWADERVDGKIWNLKNPVYKAIYVYFKRMEKVFLTEAAAVVSLTHAGKAELPNWFTKGLVPGSAACKAAIHTGKEVLAKTTVIPCMADLDHFDYRRITEVHKREVASRHGIDPYGTYLGYVGSLGTWYMVEEMVQFYAVLHEKQPEVKFLVVSQDDPASLNLLFKKYGLTTELLICTSATRADMPALLSLMKAAVFFILPVYSKLPSSPTKQGELMGMGVPVICNDGVGDVGEIVRRFESGVVLTDLNASTFAEVVANWDQLISLEKEDIRKAATRIYSLVTGVRDYCNIYAQIANQN